MARKQRIDIGGYPYHVINCANGALVSDIVIDTSTAATDTIDYVATDNAGNTSTSTRTVIIESPATAEPAPTP